MSNIFFREMIISRSLSMNVLHGKLAKCNGRDSPIPQNKIFKGTVFLTAAGGGVGDTINKRRQLRLSFDKFPIMGGVINGI